MKTANWTINKIKQNDTKEPLKKLSNKQVHNIYINKTHCKQDPINSCLLPHEQTLKKPSLKKLNLPDQERYINQILNLPSQNIFFIYVDETPITFRGIQYHYIIILNKISVYVGQNKLYFIKI